MLPWYSWHLRDAANKINKHIHKKIIFMRSRLHYEKALWELSSFRKPNEFSVTDEIQFTKFQWCFFNLILLYITVLWRCANAVRMTYKANNLSHYYCYDPYKIQNYTIQSFSSACSHIRIHSVKRTETKGRSCCSWCRWLAHRHRNCQGQVSAWWTLSHSSGPATNTEMWKHKEY